MDLRIRMPVSTPEEFRAARVALGLTQAELADRLGMGKAGRRNIRRWEKGEAPIGAAASAAIEALLAAWQPEE